MAGLSCGHFQLEMPNDQNLAEPLRDLDQPLAQRPPRTQSRDARRLQLIAATIKTLAERGYARTTLTEVARRAGLSHGLVLFHFQSKENLLAETLSHMAEEYHRNWQAATLGLDGDPAAQLHALILADFTPEICTPHLLAAWSAFWGEAQSLPVYQEICGAKDEVYSQTLERLSAKLLAQADRKDDPVMLARVLRLTQEGTWMDITTMADPYSADMARATVLTCARQLFREQFPY
jgi:TetR/AcrR family transcriptional repressor of bet genes